MNIQEKQGRTLKTQFILPREAADSGAIRKLDVNVIFTTEEDTLSALKTAHGLAFDLDARINLIVAQCVPWELSLAQPPVAVECTEQRLSNLVSQGGQSSLDTNIHVYLCRNKMQTLLKVLRPKSLVVVGGRMIWWFSKAARIARMLKRHGHRVVFAAER